VERVELALVAGLLCEKAGDEGEMSFDPGAQGVVGDGVQPAGDVAHHAAGVALEGAQPPPHPPELPGMGVAADLLRQARCQAGVALAQVDPRLAGQAREAQAGALVKRCSSRCVNAD
jgi:hypothetical protein